MLTPLRLPPPFLCSTNSCSLWLPCGQPWPHSLDRAPGVNPSQRQPGTNECACRGPVLLSWDNSEARTSRHSPASLRSWFQKMPFQWLPSFPGSLFPEFFVLSNKLYSQTLGSEVASGGTQTKNLTTSIQENWGQSYQDRWRGVTLDGVKTPLYKNTLSPTNLCV